MSREKHNAVLRRMGLRYKRLLGFAPHADMPAVVLEDVLGWTPHDVWASAPPSEASVLGYAELVCVAAENALGVESGMAHHRDLARQLRQARHWLVGQRCEVSPGPHGHWSAAQRPAFDCDRRRSLGDIQVLGRTRAEAIRELVEERVRREHERRGSRG